MSQASTTGTVSTALASRYLQQLCKHWGHRFEVVFTPEQGRIVFDENAETTLAATPEALTVVITVKDAGQLPMLKETVVEHINRFAFREAPLPFTWSDPA